MPKPARRKRITRQVRQAVIARQWGLCDVCGNRLDLKIVEIDHIVPVARNGPDDIDNLHALCPNCHARKTRDEARMRRRDVSGGPSAVLCWVCGMVVSPFFTHKCSGSFWYSSKK